MNSEDKSEEPLYDPGDGQFDVPRPDEHKNPASRPSAWRKVGKLVGRFAVKDAVKAEIPVVGSGLAAYDFYNLYKEARGLIEEERALAKASEIRRQETAHPVPYFMKEEKEVGVGTWKDGVRIITKEHSESLKPYIRYDVYQPTYRYQVYQPSVNAIISKAGSSLIAQKEESQLLIKASEAAEKFGRNNNIGDASERYQFLIHGAMKQAGPAYFDRVHNPEAVVRLEKFAVGQMYKDGYDIEEITHAWNKSSPFISGLSSSQKDRHALAIFDDVLHSKPLEESREAIARWRKENGIPESDRRSPQELEYLRTYKIKALADRSIFIKGEADKLLSTYRANPEMELSTQEEYMVEEARIRATGDHENKDRWIAMKLGLAGHDGNEIVKALETSPHSTGKDYGQKIVEEVYEFAHSKEGQRLIKSFDEFIAKNPHLNNETRLDKLNLDSKSVSTRLQNNTLTNQREMKGNNLDNERDRPLH